MDLGGFFMLTKKTNSPIVAAQKAEVKSDIRYILNRLVSMIETNKKEYDALVSNICAELDAKKVVNGVKTTEDKFSLQECYVIRQALHSNLVRILEASKVQSSSKSKTKKSVTSSVTNIRYVADPSGKYHVIGEEDGKERILFQTDNEQTAKDFVSDKSILAAEEVDTQDDSGDEELRADDIDAVVDDEMSVDENEDVDAFGDEMAEIDNVASKYDELVEAGNNLLSAIDMGIDEVARLEAVTNLAEIRVKIEDIIDELDNINLNDIDPLGNSGEDVSTRLNKIADEMKALETKSIDIIGEYVPGSTNDSMGSDAENEIQDVVESAEMVEDIDSNSEIDYEDDTIGDVVDDETSDTLEEKISDRAVDLDNSNMDSTDEEFEADTEDADTEETDDIVDDNTFDDTDIADENPEDISIISQLDEAIDKLLDSVIVPGNKVDEVADIKNQIENLTESLNGNEAEAVEDELVDFQDDSEDVTDIVPVDESDSAKIDDAIEQTMDDSELTQSQNPAADAVDPAEASVNKDDSEDSDNKAIFGNGEDKYSNRRNRNKRKRF